MDHLTNVLPSPIHASLGNRFAAGLVDLICALVLMFLIGLVSGETLINTESGLSVELHGLSAIVFMIMWIAVFPVVEGITGKTIGKKIIGIEVAGKNGERGTLMQSLVRHIFDIIDYCLLIGLIVASFNKDKQRIGDLVANTIVIKK